MPRTPDRFPGEREDEGLILRDQGPAGLNNGDPTTAGAVRFVTNQIRLRDGFGAYNGRPVFVSASGAPSAANDGAAGFSVGMLWLRISTGVLYVCQDSSTGAAVWTSVVRDGDKGDITVSADGTAWTIDNDVVTNGKLANVASPSLKGRTTPATGDPEDLSLLNSTSASWNTATPGSLSVERAALTGDVIASANSNATTIASNAVTNAKAADMASPRLKGRTTSGAGDPEDLNLVNSTSATWNTGTGGSVSIERAALTGVVAAGANSNTTTFGAGVGGAGLTLSGGNTALDVVGSTSIVVTSDQVQRAALTGDVIAAQNSNATTIANDVVSNAKLANVASPSLKGRTTATAGDPEDLTLASSTTNTWNTATGGSLSVERAALTGDVTAAANSNATTIAASAVTTAKIANNAVDNTKAADMADATIKGRATGASTGDPQDLTGAQVFEILYSTGLMDASRAYRALELSGIRVWDLNGSSHYINCGSILNFERTDPFSFFGWIQASPVAASRRLLSKQSPTTARGYSITISPSGELGAFLYNGVGNLISATGPVVTDGQLHSFGVTYNGSSSSSGLRIWVDGARATNSTAGTLSATIAEGGTFGIGYQAFSTSEYWAGIVRRLSAWGSALSATQIEQLHVAGPNGSYTAPPFGTPLAWWNLDESDSTGTDGIIDRSGNNRHGTAMNGLVPRSAIAPSLVQTSNPTAGTYHNVVIDSTTRVYDVTPTGDVIITGFAVNGGGVAGNTGFGFYLVKNGFGGRVILANNTGSSAGNVVVNSNVVDLVLEHAVDGVYIQYVAGRAQWFTIQPKASKLRINSTGSWNTREKLNAIAGGSIALTIGDNASERETNLTIAVSDGSKGDITVSGSGATWGITSGVIVDADVNASAAIAMTKTGALTGDVTKASGSSTTAIAAGVIVDADVNASAAIAMTKTGALTGDVTKASGSAATTIADGVVTNAKLGNMAEATLKGTAFGAAAGAPTDLSQPDLFQILNSPSPATADQTLLYEELQFNRGGVSSAALTTATPADVFVVPAGSAGSSWRAVSTGSNGGTFTVPVGAAYSYGMLTTSTSAPLGAVLYMTNSGGSPSTFLSFSKVRCAEFWIMAMTNAAGMRLLAGLGADVTANTFGTDGVYFQVDTSVSTTINAFCRSASTPSSASTSVALPSGQPLKLALVRVSATRVDFYVNNVFRTSVSTNVPTLELVPAVYIQNSGGFTAKQVRVARIRIFTDTTAVFF